MKSLWVETHQLPPTAAASAADKFIAGASYDTVIAGAGLTGLATAVLLGRAGQRVAVVEARTVGAVTTGHTTAKLSLLQGTTLSQISQHQSDKVLRAYVEGNREAQDWLLDYLDRHEVAYQRRPAYTYATTQQGTDSVREELRACQSAELPATWTPETELPFPVAGAIILEDQAQFHPIQVLGALAAEVHELGGELIEGVRVTGASSRFPVEVKTNCGSLYASQLVLATGTPVLDRGGYFAKLKGHRSYATTYRIPDASGATIPQGMYLSAEAPTRTLREVPLADEKLLLVGGNDHVVGRTESPKSAVEELEAWTRQHFPHAQRTHAWSAQDYRSANYIPFLGTLPRGGSNIYVATGYNKWGMTNGIAAALALEAEILGESVPWAKTLGRRITGGSDVLTGLKDNVSVGVEMASGWVSGGLGTLPAEAPAENQGVVGRAKNGPTAASTVEGTTCRVSAVCPHMGGIVQWNDAEQSWDCPLHASRFSPDGALLEGPAVRGLTQYS